MKWIKHHLETIVGIEIYPLISLLIFFLFFVGLLVYVFVLSRKRVDYLKHMPLNLENEPQATAMGSTSETLKSHEV